MSLAAMPGCSWGPSHTMAVNRCIPSLTIAPTGRVVLSQGVKIGSEGNCDASGAGTLRYEAAQRLVQFCDGTVWQEVGAAPAVSGPFTAVTGANPSTAITSNAVTVTGFAGARTATATGGATIMVNSVAVGSTANVNPGDSVALRVTSSGSFDTAVNVGFSVTSISANWSVTTRSQDTTPNAFSFTNLTNQTVSTTILSDVVTVAGFDGPLSVSISGQGSPQIQINGGAWVTSSSISPGQTLRARMTTSSSFNTAHGVSVSLGTFSANWTATTNSGACTLPWGGTISSGTAATAFQTASVPFGSTCTSQTRNCSNGSLSGSFMNQNCFVQPPFTECVSVGQSFQGGICISVGPGALIAATSDAPNGGYVWGSAPTTRFSNSSTDGSLNTSALASFGQSAHPAAFYCASLVASGYDDWYLPARNELDQMYQARNSLAGLYPGFFWSSTEYSGAATQVGFPAGSPADAAWRQSMGNGIRDWNIKAQDYRVRCVRRAI
jgi:hypothetical protein